MIKVRASAQRKAPTKARDSMALFVLWLTKRVTTSEVPVFTLYLTRAHADSPGLGLLPPSTKIT